jgi:hypothetical protein
MDRQRWSGREDATTALYAVAAVVLSNRITRECPCLCEVERDSCSCNRGDSMYRCSGGSSKGSLSSRVGTFPGQAFLHSTAEHAAPPSILPFGPSRQRCVLAVLSTVMGMEARRNSRWAESTRRFCTALRSEGRRRCRTSHRLTQQTRGQHSERGIVSSSTCAPCDSTYSSSSHPLPSSPQRLHATAPLSSRPSFFTAVAVRPLASYSLARCVLTRPLAAVRVLSLFSRSLACLSRASPRYCELLSHSRCPLLLLVASPRLAYLSGRVFLLLAAVI